MLLMVKDHGMKRQGGLSAQTVLHALEMFQTFRENLSLGVLVAETARLFPVKPVGRIHSAHPFGVPVRPGTGRRAPPSAGESCRRSRPSDEIVIQTLMMAFSGNYPGATAIYQWEVGPRGGRLLQQVLG